MRKILSILLMLCMLLSLFPFQTFAADIVATDTSALSDYALGDIIEFGFYPQSEVTDEKTLAALNALDVNWVSYDYYLGTGNYGTMMADDYMKYADVTWNGKRYRAVTFSQYRPRCTWFESSLSNSYQDAYGYNTDAVYWFEFQPIKWRVLDPIKGFVVCEMIVDAQPYSNSIYYLNKAYWMDSECSLYGNNYAESSIRAWLNHTFYTTAFNSEQQSQILETQLDNTACGGGIYAKYDADDTTDKVFLLSFDDVFNVTYGFTGNELRQANISDYAICQGVKVDPKYGRSAYFLRTAGAPGSNACGITATGGSSDKYPVYQVSGIRPAICISGLAADETPDDDSTTDIGAATIALHTIDYLAFADLAYIPISNIDPNSTVKHMIWCNQENWDDNWETTDIKYSELFGNIAEWTLCGMKENSKTGFGAYAFKDNSGQVVITYRGSVSVSDIAADDWWADWMQNDFYMFCGVEGTQVSDAIEFTTLIVDAFGAENVSMTGHSLGGGICEIMSAMFGCYAETFNAAPFLDIAFTSYPEEMSQVFDGVENLNCIDHIVKGDAVGDSLGTVLKNAYFYEKSSYTEKKHGLDAFISRNDDGGICLTPLIGKNLLAEERESDNVIDGIFLYLGVSTSDEQSYIYHAVESGIHIPIYAFCGDGDDRIIGSASEDVLVGGKGNDCLDGGWGRDTYYYTKGDGIDRIYDSGSKDTICLNGFDESDIISVKQYYNFLLYEGTYYWVECVVCCNDDPIMLIYKKSGGMNICIGIDGKESQVIDMTEFLELRDSAEMTIACPVNVEIIDEASGEVVYTLYNDSSSLGAHYTDYGYFYVFEQDGEYVKAADLFEGYSIRIVGTDIGTMDVTIYEEAGEEDYTVLSITDVPVSDSFVATYEERDGKHYLLVDADSDGTTDDILQALSENQTAEVFWISFDGNDGAGTMESIIVTDAAYVLPGCAFTAPEGKLFKAWSINGQEYNIGDTYTLTENIVLTAVWEDASSPSEDVSVPSEDDTSQPDDPQRNFPWGAVIAVAGLVFVAVIALVWIKKKK